VPQSTGDVQLVASVPPNTLGAEFQVNTYTLGIQSSSSVAALSDGGFVVTWTSLTQDGSNYGIYGQRYAAVGPLFEEDNTLAADAGQLSDADGLGEISWQWQRSDDDGLTWLNISGATLASYTLDDEDVGNLVRVEGTYTDGQGFANVVYSAASPAITIVNDEPVGFDVGISGSVAEGSQLTAVASVTADDDGLPEPLAFSWQWQSSEDGVTWTDIPGATGSTFTPDDPEVGSTLRVVASYTDGNGTVESTESEGTDLVTNVNDAPSGSVIISGDVIEDSELTASNDLTDNDGLGVVSYQWQISDDGEAWADIPGATGLTFTPDDPEVGSYLRVVASYTDGFGAAESVSSASAGPVGNVNDEPVGFIAGILGDIIEEGVQLSADASVVSDADGLADPVAFSWQWQSSEDGVTWADIPGATASTFTPDDPEVGSTLRVVASYTDGNGTVESIESEATALVTNVNDEPTGGVRIVGEMREGQMLSVASDISDGDGIDQITFTWYKSSSAEPIGTGETYLLGQGEIGRKITVVASYTDQQGTAESISSDETDRTLNINAAVVAAEYAAREAAPGIADFGGSVDESTAVDMIELVGLSACRIAGWKSISDTGADLLQKFLYNAVQNSGSALPGAY